MDIWHEEPPRWRMARCGRWWRGWVSKVAPGIVDAQYVGTAHATDALRLPGESPRPEVAPIPPADTAQRLRLRRSPVGSPSPSRGGCCTYYRDGDSARIDDYRSAANTATRRAARRRDERRALARASLYHVLVLGTLLVQLAFLNDSFATANYMVELYSGPFRSMSHALQRTSVGTATVTVDNNATFCPDVLADLRFWSLWKWIQDAAACATRNGRYYLPGHLHFSPPCSTFCRAAYFHGRTARFPGGFLLDVVACAATQCVFAIVFLLDQIYHHGLPITYTLENPLHSHLWDLPFVQPLLARSTVLDVSYCLHGASIRKTTRFVCHPSMKFDWACLTSAPGEPRRYTHLCPRAVSDDDFGKCAAMKASTPPSRACHATSAASTFLHVGKDSRMSIADAEIPLSLAAKLNRSWLEAQAHDLLFAPGRRIISRGLLGRLAAEWELTIIRAPWTPRLRPHLRPLSQEVVIMGARV